MPLSDTFVTAPQAATIMGLSHSRVHVLCRQGRFPSAEFIGSTWLIPRSDIENFKRLPAGPKGRPPTREEDAAFIKETLAKAQIGTSEK